MSGGTTTNTPARATGGVSNGTGSTLGGSQSSGTSTSQVERNAAASANGGNQSRLANGQSGYNPYVPHGYGGRNGRGGGYGVYYGNPYYPFSYGYNPGWYGNSYGNNYNNYPNNGYSFYGGTATGNYQTNEQTSTSTGNAESNMPAVTRPPTAVGDSAVAVQAQVHNAVKDSPALVSANNAVSDAQRNYNEARDRSLAALRGQPSYQQALDRRHKASDAVTSAKGGATVPPVATAAGTPSPSVVAAAQSKLDAGDEVTKMEQQALATDPAAMQAKAKLDQATADRDALKSQLTAQVQQPTGGH